MNRPRIIIDPGSCHCGDKDMAMEYIDLARGLGIDAVKFQLFPSDMYPQNCALPYEWFEDLVDEGKSAGVEVFASSFESTGRALIMQHCQSIKFAYGRYNGINECIGKLNVYASYKYLDEPHKDVIALYCIPEYPVPYMVSFDKVFARFQGYSDHTLGIEQTLSAIEHGATVIEKHVRLDSSACMKWPDGRFAISPYELETLMKRIIE